MTENRLREGWLIRQIDSVQKEIKAWPEWMKDLKVRMQFTVSPDKQGKRSE